MTRNGTIVENSMKRCSILRICSVLLLATQLASAQEELPKPRLATERKCCACVYQERADMPCDALDTTQCTQPYSENGIPFSWLCEESEKGCRNPFKQHCEAQLKKHGCDWSTTQSTSYGRFSLAIDFPGKCSEQRTFYAGHGSRELCDDYLAAVQSSILSAAPGCHTFVFDSLACELFADPKEAEGLVRELCLESGQQCSVSANQSRGLFELGTNEEVRGSETRLTICIDGSTLEPKVYLPPCKNEGSDCSAQRGTGGFTCQWNDGRIDHQVCCPAKLQGIDKDGNVVTFTSTTAYQWMTGESCTQEESNPTRAAGEE